MMKRFRKSGGFTLVELVVSIAVASLVTMAATTVLMLALRVNRQTSDTATQQYTVRALLTTMEKAATTGNIKKVTSNLGSWELLNDDNEDTPPMFEYVAFDRQIRSNGIVVMEDVYASNAILENGLLSISIETKEGIFESTVYCRIGDVGEEGIKPTIPTDTNSTVNEFLTILMGELNSSGKIQSGVNKGKYYSQWYIGDAAFNALSNNWNADTPWCACYVSWALVEAEQYYRRTINGQEVQWYSHVDEFEDHFLKLIENPAPGNLIFFNLDQDAKADHMGVVLNTTDDDGIQYVITIEGNSAGRVTMRRYKLTDERILGYGAVISSKTEQ